MSPLEQSGFQRASEWIEQGLAPADAQAARAMRTLLFEHWHGDVPRARADSAWAAVRARPWFAGITQSEELFARLAPVRTRPSGVGPAAFVRARVREHFFYDPIPVAERLRVPVLHLYGEADRHLPVAESAAAFRAAYARAGAADATIRVIAHAGHGMQAVTADAECFGCLPEARLAWAPAAGWLDTLSTWLERQR
jgi:pimeloyl-ACP methyl ester carboxylesterase